MKILASLFLVATAATAAADDDAVCISETNTYTARVNLYAGELGYDTEKSGCSFLFWYPNL
jgi:hypothetical protein